MANANSTYSEPSTKVKAKVPRRAPPPITVQAMVTIAAILLVNNTGVPSSKLLYRPSHILIQRPPAPCAEHKEAGPQRSRLGRPPAYSVTRPERRWSGVFGGLVLDLDLPREYAAFYAAFCLSSSARAGRSRWSRSR